MTMDPTSIATRGNIRHHSCVCCMCLLCVSVVSVCCSGVSVCCSAVSVWCECLLFCCVCVFCVCVCLLLCVSVKTHEICIHNIPVVCSFLSQCLGPGASNTTKIPRKNSKREKEERKLWRGREKKRAIFGPPTLQGSTLLGSTLLGSTFSGNIQKLAGGSAFLMSNVFGTPASDLDEILWWATVTLFGQSLGTSKQFDGPGWLHHFPCAWVGWECGRQVGLPHWVSWTDVITMITERNPTVANSVVEGLSGGCSTCGRFFKPMSAG